MKTKILFTTVAVITSIAVLGISAPVFAAQDSECNRECLVNFMKQYLAALVAHNPKAVPFAHEIKFVENTANIPVGKGLWATTTGGPTEFQIYAADPVAQQVASLVMMKENNKDVLLGVRLKFEDLRIREAEHHVIRDLGSGAFGQMGLNNLQKPRPGLLEDVPPAERMSRGELLRIGRTYYEALTKENGKLSPFAKECERHENGMTTAGGPPPKPPAPDAKIDPEMKKLLEAMASSGPVENTCEAQISTGTFAYITDILDRRVLIADEQKGLAVGFSMFYHDSTLKEYPYKKPSGEIEMRPAWQGTFNLPAMHIYKIKKGKIYDIEATGFTLPYGTKSGWE
jgi:hypothetical protein